MTTDALAHESAIRRLLAEYCHYYDDRRPEEFAALFTEDATFTVFGTSRVGRQEIHDHIGMQAPDAAPGQHVTYNSVITIADDLASARVFTDFLYVKRAEGNFAISTAGRYHDHLVRDPDRWRFRTRTIVFLGEAAPDNPAGR